jgi:hypothetical protein
MWVTRAEYFAVVDFLTGLDCCCGRLDLMGGFHDWLLGRLGITASGIAWPQLALRLLPGYDYADSARQFPGREEQYILGLGQLLSDYLDQKDLVNG